MQFVYRTLHRVVYDDVIEFILLGKLALRRFQTLLHLGFVLGAASAQTVGQLLERRRRNEHHHGIRTLFMHLHRALHLDLEVRTRSFEVCCADCAEKTEQYIKLDKRFKTALYLMVFLGGIGFVISAFFGGDSPLRMIGAYAGQLVAGLAFIAFPYPVTSFESFHAMSIRGVTRLTRIIGLVLSMSAVVLIVLTLR